MEIQTNRLDKLAEVASLIIKEAGKERIVLLNGEMGAGKTTLIKEICLKLGVKESVSSPTFGIVNEYKGGESDIYHFDAYRLEDEEEAYDIGIEEYFDSEAWCLIEWPEKIEGILPPKNEILEVKIEVTDNLRTYIFS